MTVRPFRADHVGSLLRPKRLKEARFKFNNNELSLEELTRIEDEEIERIIEKQIEIGYIALQMENFVEVGGTLIF